MGIRNSEQLVESVFRTNEGGWPTGGRTTMIPPAKLNSDQELALSDQVIRIEWQDGIVGNQGQNGAFVEDVIEAAIQRVRFFNDNPKTRCRENSLAITALEEAQNWLDRRTRNRLLQDVENTYEAHRS